MHSIEHTYFFYLASVDVDFSGPLQVILIVQPEIDLKQERVSPEMPLEIGVFR